MTTAVYSAICKVSSAISKVGIAKDSRNAQQGYNFRGIDDVLNTLSPLLAENGLCILPRASHRTCEERTAKNGGALFYVTVLVNFDIVCAGDGSKHTVTMYGEAMDSADKATNKAMSAAYKYMAIQTFAIPTEGDNDADATTHSVAATPRVINAATGEIDQEFLNGMEQAKKRMRSASSMADLQAAYIAAYRKARTTGSPVIMAELEAEKNSCKEALEAIPSEVAQ